MFLGSQSAGLRPTEPSPECRAGTGSLPLAVQRKSSPEVVGWRAVHSLKSGHLHIARNRPLRLTHPRADLRLRRGLSLALAQGICLDVH